MLRGTLPVFLLTICLAACLAAHAGSDNTLKDELRIFAEDIATQCGSVKQQLQDSKGKGDPLNAYTLRDAVQSLCICMPARSHELTDTLAPEQLARAVSEEEFLSLFNPAVIDKCAAEQLHLMYGEQCHKRFKKAGLEVARYCACMKEVTGGYSDAKAAAIAASASDYLPVAAEAEKTGKPVPARPPILESYYQADQRCKAGKP